MKWENYTSLPENFKNQRVFDGCGISGFINIDGTLTKGDKVVDMLCILHDRENGLGAGFAGYGIYPQYKDFYALHFLFDNDRIRSKVEDFLVARGVIAMSEPIPTKKPANLDKPPLTWRIFFMPRESKNIH